MCTVTKVFMFFDRLYDRLSDVSFVRCCNYNNELVCFCEWKLCAITFLIHIMGGCWSFQYESMQILLSKNSNNWIDEIATQYGKKFRLNILRFPV